MSSMLFKVFNFPFQLFIFQNSDIYRFIIKFGIILKFNRGLSTVLAVLKKTQHEKGEPKKVVSSPMFVGSSWRGEFWSPHNECSLAQDSVVTIKVVVQ